MSSPEAPFPYLSASPIPGQTHDSLAQQASAYRALCYNVKRILKGREYKKQGYTSLEKYFMEKWKISRTTVYRCLDSALVFEVLLVLCCNLEAGIDFLLCFSMIVNHLFYSFIPFDIIQALEGLPELPYSEKLCGILKNLGKNKRDIRLLWDDVLKVTNADLSRVSQRVVGQCWSDLVRSGKTSPEREDDLEEDYSDDSTSLSVQMRHQRGYPSARMQVDTGVESRGWFI